MRKLALLLAVAVCALIAPAASQAEPLPVTGTIDWHDVRQTIDGWGASGAFGQAKRLQDFPEPLRSQLLDTLYSPTDGIGLTIVRNLVPKLSNVPFVYSFPPEANEDQVWLAKQAQARGASYVMGTVWSPPQYMKSNLSMTGGGHVRSDMYPAYADYLVNYVKGYQSTYGLTINGVSIANEPNAATNYDSSEWTAEEFHTFIRDWLKPRMALEGIDFDVIMPEVSGWNDARAAPTLSDPVSASVVDIVAAHGYHYVTTPSPLWRARDAGKRVWETEFSEFGPIDATIDNGVKWARWIHEFMTRAEVNAWLYWWAVSEVQDQEALINLDVSAKTAIINKRLWTMGNFSRYVRPGWVRMGARLHEYQDAALVSAYRNPSTGDFAVVAVNDSASQQPITLTLNGATASAVTPHRTSATEDLAPLDSIPVVDRAFSASLAPKSVTTFTGNGTSTTPWRVSAPARVVVSSGSSVVVPVAVRSDGSPLDATKLKTAVSGGLVATPESADVLGSGTVNVTVSVPPTVTGGTYDLDLFTHGGARVATRTKVTVVGDTIAFTPFTAAEEPWLAEPGSSQKDGAIYGGHARFADGTGAYAEFPRYFVYRFDLPSDVTGGTISVDMANQFLVSASTDGRTFTEVLRETRAIRDGSNRGWRDFDIATLAQGGRSVFLRFEDPSVADGWGVWVPRVKATLTR